MVDKVRESVIEDYAVRRVTAMGGEIRKVKWIGRANAPDRRVMLPRLRAWVEFKASGKGANEAQAREHVRMRKMGERVEVINSLEGVDRLLESA